MVKEGKLWLNCLNATIGTFMFGYNLVVFNPCQKNVSKTLNWEDDESLLVLICTTLLPLGAWTGSLISARLAQRKGRRYSFIVACLIGIIGGALSSVPFTYTFASGRFVSGFSGGIFLSIVPLYINEVVPLYLKSEIGVLSGLQLGFGLVVSFSFGLIIPDNTESSYNELWIFLFAFQSLVFFIQLILFLFVFKHDTPQFYRTVRKYQEADAFFKNYEIYEEFSNLHEFETEEVKKGLAYKDLCSPENRKQFRICIALFSLQQLCGTNFFGFYSVEIFRDFLEGKLMAKLISVGIGFSEFVSQIFVLLIVKKLGRRTLILWGVFLMMINLALVGFLVYFEIEPPWIIIFPLFFYNCGFSMSTGVTIYIYAGETLEEKAISIVTGISRFSLIIIALVSPELVLLLGIPYTLGIFALIIFLYFVYLCFDIVETKGLTREQIKQLFATGKYN